MTDQERVERVDELLAELADLLADEPWIFVATGICQTNAETDNDTLVLLRDAAKVVMAQKLKEQARAMVAGFFGRE